MVISLYGCKLLTLSHHTANFSGFKHCGGGDISLICQKISQDHVIKGQCNFMSGSSSFYVTNLTSLVAIGIMVVEMSLIHHVILEDYVI